MSLTVTPPNGAIVWRDLSVPDAAGLREFYTQVAGWTFTDVEMPGYQDYCAVDESGETVAGLCHARGENSGMPPLWLFYIQVDDVHARAARCVELGGTLLDGPRAMGKWVFCVIRDPAGAVCALIGDQETPHAIR